MQKYRLLLVEDDPNLGQILQEYLEVKGFKTTLCQDGISGREAMESQVFDICILDIMLPRMDGFTLAREIRAKQPQLPFIFLTAKSMKEDTIEGLRMGADDYMTKPFSMEELLLRLKVILKRSTGSLNLPDEPCRLGRYLFDYSTRLLTGGSQQVKLTTKEADLLHLFCQNKNKTLDRSVALKMIWKDDSYFNARSMDVYITKLRKYLKEDERIEIQTIHGQGFRLLDQNVTG
jgi:DNA-binding response OmpR family regulator